MTPTQRQLQNCIDTHAEQIVKIMQFCDDKKIKYAEHQPLLYAASKMHGMIDMLKSAGLDTTVYNWAYALQSQPASYFAVQTKVKQERPRTQHNYKPGEKVYSTTKEA